MSTKNGVAYRKWLVPESKYYIKCTYPMVAKKITIHNTDNQMPAYNEASYMRNNSDYTSWHLAIDEIEAIQCIPFDRNAWAAGDGNNGYGNRNTIHVEICRNYDRARGTTILLEPLNSQYNKAEQNSIKVIAAVMIEQGIKPVYENIKYHKDWSGKWCPSKILSEGRENQFKAAIIAEALRYSGQAPAVKVDAVPAAKKKTPVKTTPAKSIVKKYAENGIFYPREDILVRDCPSVSGKHIATYSKSDVLRYHTVHIGNGYVWLEYRRAVGGSGFLPCREYSNGKYGEMWGTDTQSGKKTSGGIDRIYAEEGTFYPNTTIVVRNQPTVNSAVRVLYHKGEHVTYHKVHEGNGHVWLEYLTNSNTKAYIPCCTYANNKYGGLWGTIK